MLAGFNSRSGKASLMVDPRSADQLKALLDHSHDIILVIDEAGTISFVNSAVEPTLGYTPDELVGTNAFDFVFGHDRETVWNRFIELFETPGESTDRVQHRMKDKDGRVLWGETVGSNQSETALEGYVINTRDITEMKEREAQLARQNDRLDQFASILSHDLRNPLNVALGRVALAQEEYDSEHLASLQTALERMESLIENILTLARQGQPIDEPQPVTLSTVAEQCWAVVDTKEATLTFDGDLTFLADPSRLRQLLENLFRNSVDHSGDDVMISVGALSEEPGFYVTDDGPGIPEAERSDVFESGYSTAVSGTGFGLAIVTEIADVHGWSVRLTEAEAGGARFEFSGVEVDG